MDNNVYSHHLPSGTMLGSKYRIESSLGEGGFGITYKGTDTLLNMAVAIKEYFPHGYASRHSEVDNTVTLIKSGDEDYFHKWKEKFLNEARTIASLNDIGGIVNVRDFFEDNGTAYIVMEFLKGENLKSYVANNGAIPAEKMEEYMIPLLKSLQRVHEQGVIHRDISPENIMLMPDDTLKLYDFGAARDYSGQEQRSLSVMLKPGYAPQEQYRSRGNQGPWTDIYALCATAYYCITGTVPLESMERVFDDTMKTPSELGINIRPEFEQLLMKGMAIKETDRIQSAGEMLSALGVSADHIHIRNISSEKPVAVDRTEVMKDSSAEINRTSVMSGGEQLDRTMPAKEVEQQLDRTMPAKEVEQQLDRTMPAKEVEQQLDRTMPAKEVEQQLDRTMPAKEVEQQLDRTMPASRKETYQTQTSATPKKMSKKTAGKPNKLIGIIAVSVACVGVIAGIIGVVAGGKGETNVIISDSTITYDMLKEKVGRSTEIIRITNCTIEEDAFKAINKKLPKLLKFEITDVENDFSYMDIDFSKWERLYTVKLINCNNSGVFNGCTDKLSLLNLSVSDESVDFSFLDKVSYVTGLSICCDDFKFDGDELEGIGRIDGLRIGGFSERVILDDADIATISKATQLTDLKFENVEFANKNAAKEMLSGMEKLQWLCLNDCNLDSLDIASECTGLTTLIADNNNINDLNSLEKLIRLEKISVCNSGLCDIQGLKNCTKIISILLRNNNLSDTSICDKWAETLSTVDVSGNININGRIGNPAKWQYIRCLNISDTGIYTDSLELSSEKLVSLLASGCALEKIEFKSTPDMLQWVDISWNRLSDPELLTQVRNAEIIVASHNSFADLSESRVGGKYYSKILLHGNQITAVPYLSESFNRPSIITLNYNEKFDEEALKKLSECCFEYIVEGVPLDRQLEFEQAFQTVTFDTEYEECDKMERECKEICRNITNYSLNNSSSKEALY